MKKLLFIAGCFIITMNAFSQTASAIPEDKLKIFTKDVCACITPGLDTLHPSLKTMIRDMAELGDDSASAKFESWYKTIKADEQAKVDRHMAILDQGDDMIVFKNCEQQLSQKHPDVSQLFSATDPGTYKKIMSFCLEDQSCKLLGYLLKAGERREQK